MQRVFLLSLSLLLFENSGQAPAQTEGQASIQKPGQIPGQTQGSTKKITEDEIKNFINGPAGEEVCNGAGEVHVGHLEYYDFTGEGQEEAVVVASTCMTGTAGPDVHAVYKRGADGNLVELPFTDKRGDPALSDQPTSGRNVERAPVFGNPNYELSVENGKLVARWGDSSDRENPVVIWYKWDGTKFAVDHKKIEGPFPTSYDCAKATKEMDRAICYSPSIAAMDVQLGEAYRAALQKLPAEKKLILQKEQREWLVQREKECTIYKWWVDCLKDLYTKRIAELKQQ